MSYKIAKIFKSGKVKEMDPKSHVMHVSLGPLKKIFLGC